MKTLLKLALLSLVFHLPGAASEQQPEKPAIVARIALVSSDHSDSIRNVLTLAEVRLSELPGVQLLERQAIDKVLAEQKLSLSGVVAAEQALTLGKLLSVDLFAVLEAGTDPKAVGGLVIFDARTGVRLWDARMVKKASRVENKRQTGFRWLVGENVGFTDLVERGSGAANIPYGQNSQPSRKQAENGLQKCLSAMMSA